MSLISTNFRFLSLLFFCLSWALSFGQSHDTNKSVQIYAEIDVSVPHIILHWDTVPNADNYVIYRKSPEELSWGDPLNTYDGGTTIFLDEDVESGQIYEYRITKVLDTGTLGYGYIYCGMEIVPEHFSGNILLVIDTSNINEISTVLDSYEETLRCSGWDPIRLYVNPLDEVMDVKNSIVDLFEQDQYDIRNIFLIGHVPVPYSGSIAPDGHSNHVGAWPADGFYGDIDGFWSDSSVSNTTASSTRNHNVPGDGKFDQSVIPSDIDVPVGRVDFSDLPAFSESESELLQQYFTKNIDFRMKHFAPKMRGLIENNFSSYDEGFGQNGLKNFSTLLGPGNYSYADFDNVENDSYIWAYGCGGGTYTSAGGISSSANLAADSVQAVFTMLFGSYFGDWDSQNNFMRSALGSGTILSCSWAARPNWQFHPMGLGFDLGYCAILSQNNPGFTYSPGFGNRQIHVGLMGDPSLKMRMVAPPDMLSITESNGNALLTWEASPDTVSGYYIYRKTPEASQYQLITDVSQSGLNFIDSCLQKGLEYEYLVRAEKLIQTPSGSYYELSTGIKASQMITTDAFPHAEFTASVNLEELTLTNTSQNATNYFWEIPGVFTSEEEHPGSIEITDPDDYTIYLIAYNACGSDTTEQVFTISGIDESQMENISFRPNPVNHFLFLELDNLYPEIELQVINNQGQLVIFRRMEHAKEIKLDCSDLPNGPYILWVNNGGVNQSIPFAVVH